MILPLSVDRPGGMTRPPPNVAPSALAALLLGLLLSGHVAPPASAQEAIRLRGELFIAGRHAIDPPTGEPKNSHAYFTVEGPAALRMFRNMTSKEEPDLCRGDGWKLKRSGNLYCSLAANGKDAACDFSVDMRAGALAAGKPC